MLGKNEEKHVIMAVHLTDRVTEAVEVQRNFTAFGRYIKTRLGLHEINLEVDYSSPSGLIVLEMVGPDDSVQQLEDRLNAIEGVEARHIVFLHPAP